MAMTWTDRTEVEGRHGWWQGKPHPSTGAAAVWIMHVDGKWYVSGLHQIYDAFGPYKTVDQAKDVGEMLFEAGLLT